MTDDLLRGLDAPSAESLWTKEDPARPGDTVAGKILRVSTRETDWGPRPVLTLAVETYIRLEKGRQVEQKAYSGATVAAHCLHSILAERVEECHPRPGGRIAMRYDGEKANRDGSRKYHAWSVFYQPPAPGADLVAGLDEPVDDDEEPF